MLSIVIPTLNEEELLPRLLASLERQRYRDFEVIVADANSTDRTQEIARATGARIVDGGLPAVGRNRGAAVARGDIILFLDADVILPHERFLEEALWDFTSRGLAVATMLIEAIAGRPIDTVFYGFYNAYIHATERFLPHAHGFFILVRTDIHRAIGGFDPEIRLAEDVEYAQRASKVGKFGVIRNPRIPVSTRRFDRDGHFQTVCKYVLCELHMWTLGSVKTDIFKYRFGYPKGVERTRSS